MTAPTIFDRIEAGEYSHDDPPPDAPDAMPGPDTRALWDAFREAHAPWDLEQKRLDALLRRDILLHFGVPEAEHGGEFLSILFDTAWDEVVGDLFGYETHCIVSFERLLPLYRLYCGRPTS